MANSSVMPGARSGLGSFFDDSLWEADLSCQLEYLCLIEMHYWFYIARIISPLDIESNKKFCSVDGSGNRITSLFCFIIESCHSQSVFGSIVCQISSVGLSACAFKIVDIRRAGLLPLGSNIVLLNFPWKYKSWGFVL